MDNTGANGRNQHFVISFWKKNSRENRNDVQGEIYFGMRINLNARLAYCCPFLDDPHHNFSENKRERQND